jgi:hypothetical protein
MSLLSMGLYGIALGEAVQWALQFWPGTSQNDATFTPLFLALFLVVGASLLLLVSLLVLKVHWLLVIAAFLLSLLTPFVQGRLFPADVTLWTTNWFLTYGGGVVVLSFILLGRLKGVRPVLWRTLLVTAAGAAIPIAVLVLRGPADWQPPTASAVFPLVSLLVGGVLVCIVVIPAHQKRRRAQP